MLARFVRWISLIASRDPECLDRPCAGAAEQAEPRRSALVGRAAASVSRLGTVYRAGRLAGVSSALGGRSRDQLLAGSERLCHPAVVPVSKRA